MTDKRTEVFEEQRRTLFGIAYRMLGSVADAEDIVQDAWLRWNSVTVPVERPRAYLARTVTNLALNRLDSAAVRRETYVGPWLPEPLVTAPDVVEAFETVESVSLAMLVVLETLSPLERAVFVLKEVFGFSFKEIAEALDKSEAAVRQTGRRARSHVDARQPRYDTDKALTRQVTEEFLTATLGGDLNRMLELLAPDVTAWTDGGGKVTAAIRPLYGPNKVARFLLGVIDRKLPGNMEIRPVLVNGQAGLMVLFDGVPDSVGVIDVADGKVAALRLVRNPDKLRHLTPS
jgi:RNA polymerase sigma-70 factor (ECF subfamily)